jgi:GRF zinc finger
VPGLSRDRRCSRQQLEISYQNDRVLAKIVGLNPGVLWRAVGGSPTGSSRSAQSLPSGRAVEIGSNDELSLIDLRGANDNPLAGVPLDFIHVSIWIATKMPNGDGGPSFNFQAPITIAPSRPGEAFPTNESKSTCKYGHACFHVPRCGSSHQPALQAHDSDNTAPPTCACGVPAGLLTVKKTGKNHGRMFWRCCNRPVQCKYFSWYEDTNKLQKALGAPGQDPFQAFAAAQHQRAFSRAGNDHAYFD